VVYLVSFLFGVVAGFAVPAENSIVPYLVRGEQLQAGNSVIMALGQLAAFAGPALAGVLIGSTTESLTGVAIAFGFDTATFAVSTTALLAMRGLPPPVADPEAGHLLTATIAGIRYLWRDRILRTVLTILLVVNLLLLGPLLVGIPLLAHERLPGGATAFGAMMSAFALGNLSGYLVAGGIPRPGGSGLRGIIIGFVLAFGLGIGTLGVHAWLWVDCLVLGLLGLGNGFLTVILVTWMQARVPGPMVGRMMSVMVFATSGLVPVSEAAAGVVGRYDLTALFLAPAVLVLALGAALVFLPALTELGHALADPVPGAAAEPVVAARAGG
jgi:MFS family permease